MKYWNKDKKVRQKHWFKVNIETDNNLALRFNKDLKRELQLYDSPGKFYLYYAGRYVWFEREQDAVWFSLKFL